MLRNLLNKFTKKQQKNFQKVEFIRQTQQMFTWLLEMKKPHSVRD